MDPPTGVNAKGLVCKLNRSLYGLKQSPRCWNSKFNEYLQGIGFEQCESDRCIYVGEIDNERIILVLYVDDGLILSKSESVLIKVLKLLESRFKITYQKPDIFVGLEIERGRDSCISINVSTFIHRIIKRFGLTDANGLKIPADPNVCLTDPQHEPSEETVPYRELIGSLIFIATTCRPDISYITNVLSRYMNNYGRIHWNAAKRVVRYLKETDDLGIIYNLSETTVITGYSDSDFASDL